VINGYNGLTFNQENPKELAQAIMKLKNNSAQYRELGYNNYELTTRVHLKPKYIENIKNMFNEITKEV